MDWISDHVVAIMGMFITGGISAFAMRRDNYQKYELAFYQKVIDKRLKVYELVESLLGELDKLDATTEKMYCISNPAVIENLIPHFSSIMKMRIWLSKETYDYLNLLNSLLVSYLYYINGDRKRKLTIFLGDFNKLLKSLNPDIEKIFLKVDNYESIQDFVQNIFLLTLQKLIKLLIKDYSSLHETPKFFKEQRTSYLDAAFREIKIKLEESKKELIND